MDDYYRILNALNVTPIAFVDQEEIMICDLMMLRWLIAIKTPYFSMPFVGCSLNS